MLTATGNDRFATVESAKQVSKRGHDCKHAEMHPLNSLGDEAVGREAKAEDGADFGGLGYLR